MFSRFPAGVGAPSTGQETALRDVGAPQVRWGWGDSKTDSVWVWDVRDQLLVVLMKAF